MSINQEVLVIDGGVHRLGRVVFAGDGWVQVYLTGQNVTRKFCVEQVKAIGGGQ